jgi:predicted nucleotide-binding protein (sugar kinase/HSP70/actin superfamily)
VLLYFMATASGPCRFGQYLIFMEDLIRREQIADVAMFPLTSENGYAGLKNRIEQRAWWAVVISDVMEDIRSMLLANAKNAGSAMTVFEQVWEAILHQLEKGSWKGVETALSAGAGQLKTISLKQPAESVPVVGLVGEIFVRRDGLSRQWLTEYLSEKGVATTCAPVAEWLLYCDYLVQHDLADAPAGSAVKLKNRFKNYFKRRFEKRIKSLLSGSGLVQAHPVHIPRVIDAARPYLSPMLTGEAILTIGQSMTEVVDRFCGIIAISPFGCMPGRIAEAILSQVMTVDDKLRIRSGNGHLRAALSEIEDLPFLAIESDGTPFPPQIHAKLEAFCMRALRLHEGMR